MLRNFSAVPSGHHGLFRFLLSFALIPSSDLHGGLISILEGLGGQAGCRMYWALGSRRSLFRWLVLCSVDASRRCYLGVSDSHLLLSRSGSNWCDTAPMSVKPSVTDFTQV